MANNNFSVAGDARATPIGPIYSRPTNRPRAQRYSPYGTVNINEHGMNRAKRTFNNLRPAGSAKYPPAMSPNRNGGPTPNKSSGSGATIPLYPSLNANHQARHGSPATHPQPGVPLGRLESLSLNDFRSAHGTENWQNNQNFSRWAQYSSIQQLPAFQAAQFMHMNNSQQTFSLPVPSPAPYGQHVPYVHDFSTFQQAQFHSGRRFDQDSSQIANAQFPPPISNDISSPAQPIPETGRARRRYDYDCKIESPTQPQPTKVYLAQAKLPLRQLPDGKSQPLLIIFDINGTLGLRRHGKRSLTNITHRPGLEIFLSWLFDEDHQYGHNHRIMVWSSARPENVRGMVANLFTESQRNRLIAVWARDKLGLTAEQYNHKVQVYKELRKVWDDPVISASHPLGERARWNQTNTVLVDDSVLKAAAEPHNLLQITEFDSNTLSDDDALESARDYLEEASRYKDVSAYIRSRPFVMGSKDGVKLQQS